MSFLVLIIILCCISLSGWGRKDIESPCIGLEVSSWLRGLLVLLVIFHHIDAGILEMPGLIKCAISCGKYAVCLFFFMSGYGLMLQYCRKGREMFVGYLPKRASKLGLPILIALLVYTAYYAFVVGSVPPVRSLGELEWFVPYSWFVYELAGMYLLFFILFRFLPARYGLAALYAIILLLMFGISRTELNGHWWISSLSFPLGCTFAYSEPCLVQRRYVALLAGLVLLALRVLWGHIIDGEILSPYPLLGVPAFLCVSWYVLPLLHVRKKSVLSFLGGISYEIYLYQGLAFALAAPLGAHYPCLYAVVLFVAAAFFGVVMNRGTALLRAGVGRRLSAR